MNEGITSSTASLSHITDKVNDMIKESGIASKTPDEQKAIIASLADDSALDAAAQVYNKTYENSLAAMKAKSPSTPVEELETRATEIASLTSGLAIESIDNGKISYKPVQDKDGHATGVYGLIFDGVATRITQTLAKTNAPISVEFRLPEDISGRFPAQNRGEEELPAPQPAPEGVQHQSKTAGAGVAP